jgi:inner membrane transporter RhtA
MVALRRLSAKTFGTLMSFEPAIAAIAGVAFLHEHLTPVQWLAIGFIIAASIGAVSGEP